jgi:hypothetical protein
MVRRDKAVRCLRRRPVRPPGGAFLGGHSDCFAPSIATHPAATHDAGAPMCRFRAWFLRSSCPLVLALTTLVAAAQVHETRVTDSTLRLAGLHVERATYSGVNENDLTRQSPAFSTVEGPRAEVAVVGSAVLLEFGRIGPDGRFIRPRLTIGNQSPVLRAWMGELGLPAERCLFPAFRGRLKRDRDSGNVGASILVSARCTFN